ncbi:MAG: RNA 2',3'-cyclic phosphodiesterase [Deltaproteobacteria bacterium]|nr:RNA 2',3'-cyclic phosphodiesterase [Deltaproteobacteria bacterium]
MRAFIAIELPSGLTQAIKRLQAGLAGILLMNKDIAWAKPENIHLTIKFLGDIEEGMVPVVAAALNKASAGIGPFTLIAKGVGMFPDEKKPRVLWVGISQCPPLKRLWSGIEDGLNGLGFGREEREFSPHLTLCRIKSPAAGRAVAAAVAGGRPGIDMDFRVDSFVLFKSDLSSKGARYTELKRIALTESA